MNIISSFRNGFLKIFGDIKIFKFPFFLLYDPGSYKVKGHEIRQVIESIKAGDIMVRGYSNYLDGYFIPGFFSHAGLYLGTTGKNNVVVPDCIESKFYEGKQVVIHSMAEGVFMEDVINFCKCDYLLILRRNPKVEPEVNFEDDFKLVFEKAMKNLGKEYDFKFDFSDIGNLSCTELVYVCNDHFLEKYNVRLKKKRVLFTKRTMLIPDDFVTKEFEIVFSSQSIKPEKLARIISLNQ